MWQSIPCVLMIWQCKRWGHQQPRPWLWQCKRWGHQQPRPWLWQCKRWGHQQPRPWLWQCKRWGHQQPRPWLVCSTPLLTLCISLYTASVVSLKTALIGWRASDCDASIQLLHIQTNTRSTLLLSTWRPSPTWRKQKIFPFPGTVALWVFYKSREFPAFFRGCGQSYAHWHGTLNSLGPGQFLPE